MFMGVTWIFGIISLLTERKETEYMCAILISLQGVFLLICYSGNKEIISKVRNQHPGCTDQETGNDVSPETM